MTKESAKYIVQRGASQFKCQGDQLRDKLKGGDLLVVQHDSDNEASKWEYKDTGKIELQSWTYRDIAAEQGVDVTEADEFSLWRDVCIDRVTDTAYYLDSENIFKSTDNENWTLISTTAPWMDLVRPDTSLKISANNGVIYVVVNAKVFESTDEGQSWIQIVDVNQLAKVKNEPSVKFGTRNGQPFAYWSPAYRYSSSAYYLFTRSTTEPSGTWTRTNVRQSKFTYIEWSDEQQTFYALYEAIDDVRIYELEFESDVVNQLAQLSTNTRGQAYDCFVVTTNEIFATTGVGDFGNSKRVYFDGTIAPMNISPSTSATPRHGSYVLYDRTIDDVLYGEHRYSSNSTTTPKPGRFYLCNWTEYSPVYEALDVTIVASPMSAGHMYYWPKIGRYIQASKTGGVGQSPKLEYCSAKINNVEGLVEGDNIDEIADTDWLCCTDDDDVTYKVRGAQFKELFGDPPPPWEGHEGGIWHVFNLGARALPLTSGPWPAYDPVENREYLGEVSEIRSNTQLVLLTGPEPVDLFAQASAGLDYEIEFGEFTDTSKVTSLSGFMKRLNLRNDPDFSKVDFSSVTDLKEAWNEFGGPNVDYDFSSLDVSSVTTLERAFKGYKGANPTSVENWNTASLENCSETFSQVDNIDIDISLSLNWYTSKVTTFSRMFANCSSMNGDVSALDTSSSTSFSSMFADCKVFEGIGLENFATSNCVNMSYMFANCYAMDRDISGWDTSLVKYMQSMFNHCDVFNQDLSGWCVELISSKPSDFDYRCYAWTLPKPVWGRACP